MVLNWNAFTFRNTGLTSYFYRTVALTAGTLNGGSSSLEINFTGSSLGRFQEPNSMGTGTVNFGGIYKR
jgi:hypothetical protein